MTQFSGRLQYDIDRFRERVLTDPAGVLDPEGVIHHEFVSRNHGRKLDFDKILEGTDFYIDWVSIYARAVLALYPKRRPDALVGIANGANRLSRDVAKLLGGHVLGLTTEKIDDGLVRLDSKALAAIEEYDIKFALTIEDVATTGGTASMVVSDLRRVGVRRVESVNFWQRNLTLQKLDEENIYHRAVILDPLPMYSPEECETLPDAYCANGVALVPHGK